MGTLIHLDGRRRAPLVKLAKHDTYIAEVDDDGVITLTPAVVMPASEVVTSRIDAFRDLDAFLVAERGVRRTRPDRKKGGEV